VRRRLIATTTALVAIAIIALSLPLAIAVRGQLTTQAFERTQGVAEQASLLLDATARSCSEVQLRVAQLQEVPATLSVATLEPRLVATTAATVGTARIASQPLREASTGVVGRAVTDDRLVVTVPLSTTVCGQPLVLQADQSAAALTTRIRGAWLTIAAGATLVAAASAAFAGWYGRRIARPFEALATSARSLGDGDFSTRAPRSGIEEADAIAAALDDTAGRLGRTVERASAFTADASHQLRTPLTALRLQLDTAEAVAASAAGGSAAGASATGASSTGGRDRDRLLDALAAAQQEAERIGWTIEELVTLTRLDVAETEVEVAAFLLQRLPAWRTQAAEAGREVELQVLATDPRVRARPAALAQILQVLIDNALEHGRGAVDVVVEHRTADRVAAAGTGGIAGALRICVRDEGAQPRCQGEGEVAFGRRGGRGLPLARALAAAEGGRLDLVAQEDGTRACLSLPATEPEPHSQ